MKNPLEFLSNKWNRILEDVWYNRSKDLGSVLIYTGTIGWFLSSAAQTLGVVFNDKYTKKEKSYLLPHEITDGIVNIVSTFTLCSFIKKFGDKIVDEGKFLYPKIAACFEKIKIDGCNNIQEKIKALYLDIDDKNIIKPADIDRDNAKKPLTFVLDNIHNFFDEKYKEKLPHITFSDKNFLLNNLEQTAADLKNFKNGLGFISVATGAVLSLNILAPLIRNHVASSFQKRAQIKQQEQTAKMLQYSAPKLMKKYNFTGNPLKVWQNQI